MSAQIEESSPPGQFYCPTCEKNFQIGPACPTDGTRLMKLNLPIDPMLGREIDGRYTILEKLGQGGMGAVYRASQHGLDREVAIKVVSAHLVTDASVVKRFLREAKLASRLSHPNAVAVLEFGQTEDGMFFLVMELVTGRTLDQVLKAEHQLRPDRVVRIGMQVCDALEGAHALSIVHRDLKPANIMLLTPGRDLVKVLDFGLAKSVAPDQTTTTMTNAGALLGTPAFMPPELALGGSCDGRADLYSLGVVLYLAGSGRLPFISESAHELIAMHGTEVAPPMTGVPPALAQVIDRMLRKDPAERYQSAVENREALEAAVEGRFTPIPGVDPQASLSSRSFEVSSRTAVPRSATEVARFGVNDTIAAGSAPPKRKSRVVPLVGGLVVVGAVAAGAFVVVNKTTSVEIAPPAAPEPKSAPAASPPEQPTPPEPRPPEPRPPEATLPAPKSGAAATTNLGAEHPLDGSAVSKAIELTVVKDKLDDKKRAKKVAKPKGGEAKARTEATRTPEPTKTPEATKTTEAKTTTTEPKAVEDATKSGSGAGSAKKQDAKPPF